MNPLTEEQLDALNQAINACRKLSSLELRYLIERLQQDLIPQAQQSESEQPASGDER